MHENLINFLAEKEKEFATLDFAARFKELQYLQNTILQEQQAGASLDSLLVKYRDYQPAALLAEKQTEAADTLEPVSANLELKTAEATDKALSALNEAVQVENTEPQLYEPVTSLSEAQTFTEPATTPLAAGETAQNTSTPSLTIDKPLPDQAHSHATTAADSVAASAVGATYTSADSTAAYTASSATAYIDSATANAASAAQQPDFAAKDSSTAQSKWQSWQDARLTAYIWQLEHNCASLPPQERQWRVDAAKNAINEMLAENIPVEQILLRLPDPATFVDNFNTANQQAGIKSEKRYGSFAKLGALILSFFSFFGLQIPLALTALGLWLGACACFVAAFFRLLIKFFTVYVALPDYVLRLADKIIMPLPQLSFYGTPLYYALEFVVIILVGALLLLFAHLLWGIVKMLSRGIANLWQKINN